MYKRSKYQNFLTSLMFGRICVEGKTFEFSGGVEEFFHSNLQILVEGTESVKGKGSLSH